MQTPGPETLELVAQGREPLVLDVALPVLAAWSTSVRVTGFRPSMGVSGLAPREVARLRTLGLASSAKATGVFEGANDFRLGFRGEITRSTQASAFGVEADLGGHHLGPVVSDLMVSSFGLPIGHGFTHRLNGFTHHRGAGSQGYGSVTLQALGREFGLDLKVVIEELGFEPQGLGRIAITASRTADVPTHPVGWTKRGELRGIHLVIGGVRPKIEQLDRLEAALREVLWEARRIEPVVERLITPGADLGAFLQLDVLCDSGGATFVEVVSRASPALPLARRAVRKALGFWDSLASCDEVTGIAALASAIAARGEFEIALVPSDRLSDVITLLRDIGASVVVNEAPGLLVLKTSPRGS